ncbi:hypothetical protein D3C77_430300 [compost metagenome]
MAVGVLRRAEERNAAGEETVQHGFGDGVRQGKTGQRCGKSVLHVDPDRTAVEEDNLANLEHEQRQWRNGEDQQRRIDPLRHDDHRRRPEQGANGEEDVHAIGNPR